MTKRLPVEPAPGPLEGYSAGFDALFSLRNQRHIFRRYLEGLLLPAGRNKTLTALANTEPVVGAQQGRAQGLQWFLSESTWDPDAVNAHRLELLRTDPSTAPTVEGVLVIDEHGDRKWGKHTAHVGRQYLANIGKIDSGVVSVTSLWADERVYWPVHFEPYTPAHHFERGKQDPGFRTKLGIAGQLVGKAVEVGVPFRAVVADCFYGEDREFKRELERLGVGYVLALSSSHAWWHPEGEIGSLEEAARADGWTGPGSPGRWARVVRTFRDGREEDWWALEVDIGPYGPGRPRRAVVATTDPEKLPVKETWYLETNLPAPRSERARSEAGALSTADLAEVVRLYGLRMWVEQSYKQVKHSLGWSEYQVRSDIAIRRHWELVCCAFSFCWHNQAHAPDPGRRPARVETSEPTTPEVAGRGENEHRKPVPETKGELADRAQGSQSMVGAVRHAAAILDGVVGSAPTAPVASAA